MRKRRRLRLQDCCQTTLRPRGSLYNITKIGGDPIVIQVKAFKNQKIFKKKKAHRECFALSFICFSRFRPSHKTLHRKKSGISCYFLG